MPAYGAYKSPSARVGEAQILLNFPLIYATAAHCDDNPSRIMAETTAHELLHALEDVFERTFSEHDVETLVAAAQEIELAEGTATDAEGEALTASYMFGFEEGRKAARTEPMTSIIHWVRYDGTPETLPEMIVAEPFSLCRAYSLPVILNKAGCKSIAMDKLIPWGNAIVCMNTDRELEIGDLWAYLPEPPEGTS
jgi:hypothetical protein